MEKISLNDHTVKNKEAFHGVKEERNILHAVEQQKAK
jgi:hypothetical protein